MNRLDRNPNDPPTRGEMRARRIGAVALVLAAIGVVISVALLGFVRWTVFAGGPNADSLRGLSTALTSLIVLMVSFTVIVVAVALKNTVMQRIGTVVAVIATISGVAALFGL